eukprot:m.2103 g.2103  ORF g.2103 m.2103 type:complete len:368 (+) comp8295_c0_seq1:1214-2317(+)
MLKSKRKSFVKQLWHSREVERGSDLEDRLYQACKAFFKRIKKTSDIEELRDVILSARTADGGSPGPCFLVDALELDTTAGKYLPEVLACKLWRWPELPGSGQLKNLACCERRVRKSDDGRVCANPFHYGRLDGSEGGDEADIDVTRPRLVRVPGSHSLRCKNDCSCSTTFNESLTNESDAVATRTLSDYLDSRSGHWCTISYWELMNRVGRQYNATADAVDIFADFSHGNGLCLKTLPNERRPDAVKRVREHIGKGVQFSFEDDGIWVYNRSEYPIFVQSPTLDFVCKKTTKLPAVRRVSSGYSMRVFSFEICRDMLLSEKRPQTGQIPDDPFAFRISFAKGWGPTYTRQNISACPCWLEVFLNVHR